MQIKLSVDDTAKNEVIIGFKTPIKIDKIKREINYIDNVYKATVEYKKNAVVIRAKDNILMLSLINTLLETLAEFYERSAGVKFYNDQGAEIQKPRGSALRKKHKWQKPSDNAELKGS